MCINNIFCPHCFSKNLYRFDKNKLGHQKYQCKQCARQFSPDSNPSKNKLPYPKYAICNSRTYLHHNYLYYSKFKYNSRKCNHIQKKRLRTNINVVIDALYMYFVHSVTTRAISQYLLDRKNIKISHVSIYKWIKVLEVYLKILFYAPQNLNQSDERHVDETVIKIKGKRYYIWTLINSETRYIIDWYFRSNLCFSPCLIRSRSPQSTVSDDYLATIFQKNSILRI